MLIPDESIAKQNEAERAAHEKAMADLKRQFSQVSKEKQQLAAEVNSVKGKMAVLNDQLQQINRVARGLEYEKDDLKEYIKELERSARKEGVEFG